MHVNKGEIFLFFSRIYLARKHVQRSRVKEERDLSPTVEYPLQESPASRRSSTDPGDDAEDQGDGGYVSAATPTTTSLSGSISGASACTESGPPDGKTRIQIHSTLPFTSTQLRPELVHEQYQSRTADNRDSEDMDNKVHKFMTENNNRERQHLSLNMYSNNN